MLSNNIRAGCYVRVSTENQLENYSIDEQTERLEAYCKSMGWKNFYFYPDPGYSGGNMDRPALQQLLKDVSDGKINMVVVYKLDRLSRSQKDTLVLIEDHFLSKGAEFTSVLERFDTSTPLGRAMLGILSVFAQLEKDQITERFTMGRIGRGKAGYFHGGGHAPKGYRYVKGQKNGDGRLVIDELQAAQIREIFERFYLGHSINSIFEYMNERYGGWSHTNVYNVLKNSVYIGKVKFKGQEYDGKHEPIIDKDLFYKVQKLLKSPEREDQKTAPQKTPFRAGYVLSSLIYCKRCGARYSANHGYYKCYSRAKSDKKYIIDPNCKNDNWKIEDLDQIIMDEIKMLAYNPVYLNNLFEKQTIKAHQDGGILKRIKDIDNQISRLLDLYQIKNSPINQIAPRIDALQNEKEKLEKILNEETLNDSIDKSDFMNWIKSSEMVFSSGSIEEKRMFISYLIKSIEVDGKSIAINWRI